MEMLSKEDSHQELGLRWKEISFVDRRIKVELSYVLSDDESDWVGWKEGRNMQEHKVYRHLIVFRIASIY